MKGESELRAGREAQRNVERIEEGRLQDRIRSGVEKKRAKGVYERINSTTRPKESS